MEGGREGERECLGAPGRREGGLTRPTLMKTHICVCVCITPLHTKPYTYYTHLHCCGREPFITFDLLLLLRLLLPLLLLLLLPALSLLLRPVIIIITTRHVMLLGQDKRELGALVFPDEEYLAATGGVEEQEEGGQASSSSNNAGTHALEQLLLQEVNSINAARQDYHPEDHIAHIQVGGWMGG